MWYVVKEDGKHHEIVSEHNSYGEAYQAAFKLNTASHQLDPDQPFYELFNQEDAQADGLLEPWNNKKAGVK